MPNKRKNHEDCIKTIYFLLHSNGKHKYFSFQEFGRTNQSCST